LVEAFEIGDFVGKAESVEGAGIKRLDVVSAGIEVVGSATVVIAVEDEEEVGVVDGLDDNELLVDRDSHRG
jgi:hypothetical protein